MLDNLTTRLARVMKTLKGEARLTESNIAEFAAKRADLEKRFFKLQAAISQAHRDWQAGSARFGEVKGFDGPPLQAPPVPWAG